MIKEDGEKAQGNGTKPVLNRRYATTQSKEAANVKYKQPLEEITPSAPLHLQEQMNGRL